MKLTFMRQQRGFSLVELVMVMTIVGIVAVYAVTRAGNSASVAGSAQAQHFARDLRHAQMLAATWSRALIVTVTTTGYSVACATAGAAPCNASPVIDPARGTPFSVDVRYPNGPKYPTNASLTAGTVRFDSLGRPSTGTVPATTDTSFTLSSGGTNWTVTVRAVSGLVE